MTDDDAQLMVNFQHGDPDAFDLLVEKYQIPVLNIIHRFLGRVDAAEDLAQDVFVKVFQAADTYRPVAKFSTWLYRIVANHCLNYRRDAAKRQMVSISSLEREEAGRRAAEADGPDDLEAAELRAAVRAALRALRPKGRLAVILDNYRGMSHREIGRVLGCSEKAVKSLLARARARLRAILAPHLK